MIAVEAKGMDPKYTWEIVCIYRAASEDMLAFERLAARILPTGNLTKRSIIGCVDFTSGGLERGCGESERNSDVCK